METAAKVVRRADRYEDSFIFDRKPFTWPGGKTLAVWIIPNVEVFIFNPGPGVQPGDQDLVGYSWREYGMRVGLWRIADVMEQAGIRATVALNAGVCDVFPKAIQQMDKLGWEMMDAPLPSGNWKLIAPSAVAWSAENQTPREMTRSDMTPNLTASRSISR